MAFEKAEVQENTGNNKNAPSSAEVTASCQQN